VAAGQPADQMLTRSMYPAAPEDLDPNANEQGERLVRRGLEIAWSAAGGFGPDLGIVGSEASM
jgi:hypothetical protein